MLCHPGWGQLSESWSITDGPLGSQRLPRSEGPAAQGPHRTAARRDAMQWPSVEVVGGYKLELVYCRQKTRGQRSSGMEPSAALCRREELCWAGGPPQATCQASSHHWHTPALCQARVAGALSAGRDRAAGWGEDLLTGRETRDVALILAKFSASPRQGQGCSHRISVSLSQKCWEPTEFECLQWWVCLQNKVVTGQM